jgi:hypothetical protein
MSRIFVHLKPFTRIIENDDIQSLFSAISIFLDDSLESGAYKKNYSEDIIEVLEEVEGGYFFIPYSTSEYFNYCIISQTDRVIVTIDQEMLDSDNKQTLIEKLHNFYNYVGLLIIRFNDKSDETKSMLKVVIEQLARLNNVIKQRIKHFSSLPFGSDKTFIPKDNSEKFIWDSDEASLGNLFYDLVKGNTYDAANNKMNKIYIKNNIEVLAQIITDSFILSNGNSPSYDNIARYLRGKKASRNYVKSIMRDSE